MSRRDSGRVLSGLTGGLVAALVIAMVPVGATSGEPLILGEVNGANKGTVMRTGGVRSLKIVNNRSTGVPLELLARPGQPPLQVNTSAKVSGFNADLLDGRSAGYFQEALDGVSCPFGVPVVGFDGGGDPVCRSLQIIQKVVDEPGNVGGSSSIALDARGNPVIAYSDGGQGDVKVVACNDPACSGGDDTITTVDLDGTQPSLALNSSGHPVISYFDSSSLHLELMECSDAACAWAAGRTVSTVDPAFDVGHNSSLALNDQGHPVISYWDRDNGHLRLVACNDPVCAPGGDTISTVDSSGNVGAYPTSLVLNASGHPVVSYHHSRNLGLEGDLKLVACNDPACAPGGDTISTVESGGDVGQWSSLALNASGNPVISYDDQIGGDLKVATCNDPACAGTGETIVSVDFVGRVGRDSSLMLNPAGNPTIAYWDETNKNLKVLTCNDPACAPGGDTIVTVDDVGDVGRFPSLVLTATGTPIISYYDTTNSALKVVLIN